MVLWVCWHQQILQELCGLRLAWDDPIPESLHRKWSSWLTDLSQLEKFEVRRCFMPEKFGSLTSAQLHNFSDVSESGYGTVSYLRLQDDEHKVHCAFLMGNARVVPLKPITIPRLELTVATMGIRMDRMLQSELQLSLMPSVCWTDVTSVLKYLRNATSRFHTFIANRLSIICAASDVKQWCYVSGTLSPADCVSRSLLVTCFLNSESIQGPEFLQHP